jgi:ABC-2 type transport system permease protein
MNISSNAMPDSPAESRPVAATPMAATRPLYWSVRRELWENRSIYLAPLAVAALALIGFAISTIGLPERRRALLLLDPAYQRTAVEKPYDIVAIILILTGLLVGVFYCLDALHGERRDRSILFWKSLPVSDLTTVLSKLTVPLVILPLVTFVVIVATQLVMVLLTDAILLASGQSATTWMLYPPFHHSFILFYGLAVLALWHAPVYGWLLLVSAWAKRATFLWAVLPLIGVQILEKIAFNTAYVGSMLKHRLLGGFAEAFSFEGGHGMDAIFGAPQPEPLRFLSTPGLWIGLAVAVALVLATVRLRHSREPI